MKEGKPYLKNNITKVVGEKADRADDFILVEKPLVITVNDRPLVTVMCTPGDEKELAAGLLLSEGIIDGKSDLAFISHCAGEDSNLAAVTLPQTRYEKIGPRIEAIKGQSLSSCGICGREMIDQLLSFAAPLDDKIQVAPKDIYRLFGELERERHELFKKTGAAHSAALFDENLNLVSYAEDVGRHNALDKAVGKTILSPPGKRLSLAILSSRGSFEMVQKAARARVPVVCFGGAVTDMAVQLAQRLRLTLAGFLNGRRFNVYAHPRRILYTRKTITSNNRPAVHGQNGAGGE